MMININETVITLTVNCWELHIFFTLVRVQVEHGNSPLTPVLVKARFCLDFL